MAPVVSNCCLIALDVCWVKPQWDFSVWSLHVVACMGYSLSTPFSLQSKKKKNVHSRLICKSQLCRRTANILK